MVESSSITIRPRKFMTNPLLCRKQMILHITHPGKASVSKTEVQEKLATMFKTAPDCVVCYQMHIQYGGGVSRCYAMIYDSLDFLKKFEPKYRQIRKGLMTKSKINRRMKKDMKRRVKRSRGVAAMLAATASAKK